MSERPVLVNPGQEMVLTGTPSQLRLLTRMIQHEPDVPVHYILRGEEWLSRGNLTLARADFEAAQRLITALVAQSSWGYLYQAYGDRVAAGLRCCGADD